MSACPHTDNADKCTCGPGCGCDPPIPMSEFTLGERYASADMYRDMGIEPPRVPDGVEYVDTVRTVTVHIGEGEGP